ncbi:MAG: hypothetical protein DDT24_00077 [Chloroflexi bacterium]|nr:hypothetical protein [Chloroflexota bacterium]
MQLIETLSWLKTKLQDELFPALSRAFKEFADSDLGEKVHKALCEDHLSEELIGHISKDSTAIEGNERPQKEEIDIRAAKEQGTKEQEKKKRGRPKKGEIRYDIMDAAYDAEPIYRVSRELGHVSIIDKNKRNGDIIPMSPAEKIRYNERTVSERSNSRLKEDFGGRTVKGRGAKKVTLHLMLRLLQEAQH